MPAFLHDIDNIKPIPPDWFLGAAHTGASVHFHSNAVNMLIHGRKRWTLFAPRHRLYSTKHIVQWSKEDLPRMQGKAMHCMQEPGDVLFIPEQWGHGTENLAESVGYAMEFEFAV
jgi:ribosomal protein L16 Arg81 hydroxylase